MIDLLLGGSLIAAALWEVWALIPGRKALPINRQIEEDIMNVTTLITEESKLINKMLAARNIEAKTTIAQTLCVKSGFIAYGLQVNHGEKISKIEAMQRELANELTRQRNEFGYRGTVPVRLSDYPLALEVPHPEPVILRWNIDTIKATPKHAVLLGRSYLNGAVKDEIVEFEKAPHTLVAGITDSGKSVLMKMMILSLCYNTPPSELEIVMVDLKNEDMLPFKHLPHVVAYAGTRETAVKAVEYVVAEKDKRIVREGYKPYRLILWIDELAQTAAIKGMADHLGDLASIGRSKLINLVGATQYPTKEGGLGGLLKANFPIRLVGMVSPGQSAIATGRPQTHADMLPGKGAFLRCQGPDVHRFQSYHIGEDDVIKMVTEIGEKWNAPVQTKKDPTLSPLVYETAEPPFEPVHTGSKTVFEPPSNHLEPVQKTNLNQLFPLEDKRPLNDKEATEAKRLASDMSKNQLCLHIYGAKSGRYMDWLDEALARKDDGKIIKFPARAAS